MHLLRNVNQISASFHGTPEKGVSNFLRCEFTGICVEVRYEA